VAGAGQQIKVLEAMASGTPVVATRIVAEGIGPAAEFLSVADDPADFARQVVRLFADERFARSQARGAALMIREKYTWRESARLLDAAWSNACEGFAVRRGGRVVS
jgi:glycosyltransferase involved in cell wall biosynthesis